MVVIDWKALEELMKHYKAVKFENEHSVYYGLVYDPNRNGRLY